MRTEVFCGTSLIATIDEEKNHQYVVLHFIYRPDHNKGLFKHDPEDSTKSTKEAVVFVRDRFKQYIDGMVFSNELGISHAPASKSSDSYR